MDFIPNLSGCQPKQIVSLSEAVNDVSIYNIYSAKDCKYLKEALMYSYSVDNVCWSCYMSYDDLLANTVELSTDFYLKAQVAGPVVSVTMDDTDEDGQPSESPVEYTTQMDSGFNFSECSSQQTNANQYNPYANLEGALGLQTALSETVACMFGIPIYYFKLAPNMGSRDLTFKEYTLMDVESVKQIKLLIADGQMPSSKPEFNDWGLDWQEDWQTEISKGMFATAFGPKAQPTEGDLIYIPMMKRMWMVNEAYEEKNGSLMWNATTFKVALVKYQEKRSVDLGDAEDLVNSFVKNKYEDLFGDQEGIDSGTEATDAPKYAANALKQVYESDATRKYMTTVGIENNKSNLYFRGTMISDNCYIFNNISVKTQIVYQRQYCGDEGVVSFIITPSRTLYSGDLLNCANIRMTIDQKENMSVLRVPNNPKTAIRISSGVTYFVWLRWSKALNVIELAAAPYMFPDGIPMYKLQPHHYYFDIDNAVKSVSKFNVEMIQPDKKDVILYGAPGTMTNFKVFDVYNDNVSEILQMYPNHQHLIINDTARPVVDMHGYGT